MITLLVAVEARPGDDVLFDADREVGGYYQTLGVTASNEEEMRTLIRKFLKTDLQSTLVEITESWIPDLDGQDSDIADRVGDVNQIGIWYHSGHAWFEKESD